MNINLKPKYECRWDFASLGEVMLRFDPGNERIRSAREFRVWEGGGEYNVARGLRKCFKLRTAIFTALAKNPLGQLVEDLILQGGVDTSQIVWRDCDGSSDDPRNGMYFIERGFGLRSPASSFDRFNTAISRMTAGDVDWNWIFGEYGLRWLHTGGVFAGLSELSPRVAAVAMQFARQHGAVVSYDLNYRDSLWKARGGRQAADAVNKTLLPFADVVFGVPGFNPSLAEFSVDKFRDAAGKLQNEFPNLKIIASTLRDVKSASRHSLSAASFCDFDIYKAQDYLDTEVLDRVGSGDAFAAGFIYGLLTDGDDQKSVDYGAAHAVLAMTTPGDNSMAALNEVENLMVNKSANVVR